MLQEQFDEELGTELDDIFHQVMLNEEQTTTSAVSTQPLEQGDCNSKYCPTAQLSVLGNDPVGKIILVGPSGCGKTCIFQRLLYNLYPADEPIPTLGVDFGILTMPTGLRLQLWDTAGQERFRCLTKSYFRNVAAVVICFDVAKGSAALKEIEQWKETVDTSTTVAPSFAVVGNKCDTVVEQPNISDIYKFCDTQKIPIFLVSAKQNLHLDKLMEHLAKETNRVFSETSGSPSKQKPVVVEDKPTVPDTTRRNCAC